MSGDPWAAFRKNQAPAQQPIDMPPPVQQPAAPRLPYSPAKVQQVENAAADQGRADIRIGNDIKQNQRADEDHSVKMASIAANGGVDTQASQDQAAGHALNLLTNLHTLDRIKPEAQKPGLLEMGVSMLTDDPNILSIVRKDDGGQRQQAAAAQGSALESIIWLSTGAAVTEPQGKRFLNEITPAYGDTPETLKWKRDKLLSRIAEARVRAGPANVKVDNALTLLEQKADIFYNPERVKATTEPTEDRFRDAEGRARMQISDIAAPVKDQAADDYESVSFAPEAQQVHADWVKAHPTASVEDYIAFRKELDRRYIPPEDFGSYDRMGYDNPEMQQAISNLLEWHRANPNAEVGELLYNKKLDGWDQMWNDLSRSEPGVAVANWSNAVSGGMAEGLAGDKARSNFQKRNAESPITALIADGAGSILPISKGSKLLGKLAPKWVEKGSAANLANLGVQSAYGAARGFNAAPEDKGLSGAMLGGGLAAIGGMAGKAIGGGSRAYQTAKTRTNLDQLRGVKDLTLMQRMGKGAAEEGVQGLPIVRKARQASIESFNKDNVNRALANVGEKLPDDVAAGRAANAKMDEVLNTAYNKLRPRIQGVLDDKFGVAVRGMADPILKSGNPTKVDLFKEIQGALRVLKGGKYDGLSFKDADQKLRQLASDWSQVEAGPGITSPSTYHEMARVALKFKDQLRAQVSRNDPVVGAALKKLDKAWAHKLRIENASNRATATGVYSPQQLLTSLKMMDTSKGKGAFSRGKAFDQNYTQAAEDIIGSAPSKEHSNFLQTASMLYAMGRHPLAIGLPVSATAGANYTPGLKKIIEFLATSERPKGVEVMLRSQIPTILRKKYTENREKD